MQNFSIEELHTLDTKITTQMDNLIHQNKSLNQLLSTSSIKNTMQVLHDKYESLNTQLYSIDQSKQAPKHICSSISEIISIGEECEQLQKIIDNFPTTDIELLNEFFVDNCVVKDLTLRG